MKCQNCGKNEVNFHYSSNINGCLTETYLCSECAAKSGYDIGRLLDADSMLDGYFPVFGRFGGFFPMSRYLIGVNDMLPFRLMPGIGTAAEKAQSSCGCEENTTDMPDTADTPVDDDMKKRREINVLREQMRIAAEKDNFEKAIELREKIREMEK